MRNLLVWSFLITSSLCAQVRIEQSVNKIAVAIDGSPFTALYYGQDVPKPYMYPLRAADGTVVTRGFPMEKIQGESTDHPHQRAVWFAHDNVNGVDYWNNEFSYTKGVMGHMFVTKVVKAESGEKSGRFEFLADWKNNEGKVVLTEDRTTAFYAGGPNRVIDFDFILTARDTVTFQDGKDGVFGIRVASGLEEPGQKNQPAEPKRTGVMTSAATQVAAAGLMFASDGCRLEKDCWGKRSNWMDYSGQVEGKGVGIAILDHPDNPRHPTYWHSRGYGLFAANIFGVKQFTKAGDGSMTLKPGDKMEFCYRVIIHPGDAQSAGISALYDGYARTVPPKTN